MGHVSFLLHMGQESHAELSVLPTPALPLPRAPPFSPRLAVWTFEIPLSQGKNELDVLTWQQGTGRNRSCFLVSPGFCQQLG